MSNVDMIIFCFFLFHYILFYRAWLLSLGTPFFYKREKGVDSERKGGMEGGETVKSGCFVLEKNLFSIRLEKNLYCVYIAHGFILL